MGKNNNNNTKKLDTLEQQVLSHFKNLKPEDIKTIKDLTTANKEILTKINNQKEEILNEARKNAKEIEEKIKSEAHKSAENIINAAKNQEEKIIKEAQLEKESSLEKFNLELIKEQEAKIAEWKEKDELISNTQLDLENKIKEKEKELYEIKSKKFENYEKDLNSKFEELTKTFQKKSDEINKNFLNITSNLSSELKEKSEIIAKLELLKNENQKLEKLVEISKTYMQNYSSSRFVEIENENILLKQQVSQLEDSLNNLNNELIKYKKKVSALLSNPNLEIELEQTKKENEELREFKNNSFSRESVLEWKQKAETYDDIVIKNLELIEENTKLQTIIDKEKVDKVRLSRLNTAHQILSKELEQARYDLEMRREEYRNIENRFIGLNEIDLKYKNYETIKTNQNIKLEKLVSRFRDYMASGWYNEKLYFDLTTLRAFIAGMAASNLLLLEGLSGTGKSSLPQAFGAFINSKESKTELISVQQSWRDRNELLGYFNEFTKVYKETEFLQVLYEAVSDYNNIHIIVLDEMNIARIEYYFADFLSALQMQEEKRYINLISNHSSKDPIRFEDGNLLIGNNIWFVGTANDDDSTFMISDKVYDRAISIYFDKKGEEFNARKDASSVSVDIGASELHEMFDRAIQEYPIEAKFYKKIVELDDYIKETMNITFGNRIEKQLQQFIPVFVACGGTQEEAFDLLFERKVLRKFESRLNAKMKRELDDLEIHINLEFGEGKLKRSIKMIKELKEKY